jgi:hypothetical protein
MGVSTLSVPDFLLWGLLYIMKTTKYQLKQIKIAVEAINFKIIVLTLDDDGSGKNAEKISELQSSSKCLLELVGL